MTGNKDEDNSATKIQAVMRGYQKRCEFRITKLQKELTDLETKKQNELSLIDGETNEVMTFDLSGFSKEEILMIQQLKEENEALHELNRKMKEECKEIIEFNEFVHADSIQKENEFEECLQLVSELKVEQDRLIEQNQNLLDECKDIIKDNEMY